MKTIFMMLLVAIAIALYLGVSYAQCSMSGGEAKTAAKGEVCNTTCPVMGGKVSKDTPYKAEYNGKTIGFCCAGCVKAFKENPEKYKDKLGLENCDIKES